MVLERFRSVRARAGALDDEIQLKSVSHGRMHGRVRLDLANLLFVVQASEIFAHEPGCALLPVDRIPHAGDLAVLHAVHGGNRCRDCPASPVPGIFSPWTMTGPIFNPFGMTVAFSIIHCRAMSERRSTRKARR